MEKTQSEHYGDIMRQEEQETTCPKLIDINGVPISQNWASLFAGFFWGEGTMIIEALHSGKTYNPYCQIWLRADDGLILEEFQRRLGGRLRIMESPSGGGNPQRIWKIGKVEDCLRIANTLESTNALPFRKRRELPVWKEALELKWSRFAKKQNVDGYLEKMSRLKKQLSRLKIYEAL